jgi:hypothetical protein
MPPLDAQLRVECRTQRRAGPTTRYSPIFKDGMLSSSARTWKTRHSLQLEQLFVVSALVRIFARFHALKKGKSESRSNSIFHNFYSAARVHLRSRVRRPVPVLLTHAKKFLLVGLYVHIHGTLCSVCSRRGVGGRHLNCLKVARY